jgi:hypothetical protein
MQTVFYVGTTGYIGGTYSRALCNNSLTSLQLGSVLVAQHRAQPDLQVTALARHPAHVDAVSHLGVEAVQGTFNNTNFTTLRAHESDITIDTASSDDVELTNTILAGQKAHVVEDKKVPAIILHTSGVAVLMDGGEARP